MRFARGILGLVLAYCGFLVVYLGMVTMQKEDRQKFIHGALKMLREIEL